MARLGLTKETRPGFSAIRAPLLGALAERDPEQFEELCEFVQDASPVRDVLANSVPVSTTLEVLR